MLSLRMWLNDVLHCRWEPRFILWERWLLLGGRAWEEDGVWQRRTPGLSFFQGLKKAIFPAILTVLLFLADRIDKLTRRLQRFSPQIYLSPAFNTKGKKDKERHWGYGKDWNSGSEDWGVLLSDFYFPYWKKIETNKKPALLKDSHRQCLFKKFFANSTSTTCEYHYIY